MTADLDLIILENRGFKIIKDKTNSANNKVLVVEHKKYGISIIKYPHPNPIIRKIDKDNEYPLTVDYKVSSGLRNLEAYLAINHLPNVPELYEHFEMPEFWDIVAEKLDLNPKQIRLPSPEQCNEHWTDNYRRYFIGALCMIDFPKHYSKFMPLSMTSVDELKKHLSVPVLVTEYIEGQDIISIPNLSVEENSFRELENTVKEIHRIGYSNLDLEKKNIMLDNNGKLWIHDFGTAKRSCPSQEDSEDIRCLKKSLGMKQ